ncbi:MAG: Single-stranded-DNA-specific exonuclease RecJ [Candidatus Dichloromethanomonas elyunquensis]|nr:MAG: Single-stranded-DNA-specific exonuclease RecJ [Candidatus Dichloromethanomonas elyunquensis]
MWCLSQELQKKKHQLEEAGISRNIIHILKNRGYHTVDSILEFIRPSLFDLHSPFLFTDMQPVIHRLKKALDDQEKVLVYGDYDVDGITGTVLIYQVLKRFGFQAMIYVPTREEGYGLHAEAIEKASAQEVSLIITVDCGITAVEETFMASSLGIDMIITDHHEPQELLPSAVGILNPKTSGSGYPFRDLAGVGVAFKLAQALFHTFQYPAGSGSELEYLDLAALGTIADIVPLTGENRILVKYGLEVMSKTRHQGLQAILEECGLWGKKLKAGQISFIVAPKINAAGRMDTARLALNLLLEEKMQDAAAIAKALNQENKQRQYTERKILMEAEEVLSQAPVPEVIVLSSTGWHHGVIGIVASRLVERFRRPVFLISEEGEMGRGSARGINGYHVLGELEKQATLLSKFGGHKQAAGFTVPVGNINLFRKRIIDSFRQSELSHEEQLFIDSTVLCSELCVKLQKELDEMSPFGAGNPAPLLMTTGLEIKKISKMGKNGEHLKLILQKDRFTLEVLAFKKSEHLEKFKQLKCMDILYTLETNDFYGEETLQAILKDYRESTEDSFSEVATTSDQFGDSEENMSQPLFAKPSAKDLNRMILVEAYKSIRGKVDENNRLYWMPGEDIHPQLEILKIFEELRLLQWLGGTGPFLIELNSTDKTNLHRSLRYRLLNYQG